MLPDGQLLEFLFLDEVANFLCVRFDFSADNLLFGLHELSLLARSRGHVDPHLPLALRLRRAALFQQHRQC